MDSGKTLIIDGIEFSIKEIKLPVSVPLQKGKLIGFDFTFCKNRESNTYSGDFLNELLSLYDKEEIAVDGETDYYIKPIDLYIDLRLTKYHNFNAYDSKNKFHQVCLNQLIQTNKVDFIRQWCILDVEKRNAFKNKKFLEIYDIADLFNQIRRAVYGLSYTFTDFELKKSFYRNINLQHSYRNISIHNQLIYNFQKHIIERENRVYKNPVLRRQHIENTRGLNFKEECDLTDKDILINFRYSKKDCVPYSHFNPAIIKSFVDDYGIQSIYDPCGGWGHRMLGAWKIKYIYNDIDTRSYTGCTKMYNFCSNFVKSDKIFYNNDASNFTPNDNYDCVFTCPPYYNTEIYTDKNTSTNIYPLYNDWLNIWWRNLVKCSVKNSKYFAYVISDKYKKDMNGVIINLGLKFVEEISVGANYKSHLISAKNNNETLQIFSCL